MSDQSPMRIGPVRGVFSTSTSSEGERRPSGALGKKDFRKVLDKEEDGKQEPSDEEKVTQEQSALDVLSGKDPGEALGAAGSAMLSKPKGTPSSLFDLSSKTKGDPLSDQSLEKENDPMSAFASSTSKKPSPARSDSPSSLFSKLAHKESVSSKHEDSNLDGIPVIGHDAPPIKDNSELDSDAQTRVSFDPVSSESKTFLQKEMQKKELFEQENSKHELLKQRPPVVEKEDKASPLADFSQVKKADKSTDKSLSYNPLAEARAQEPLVNPLGDLLKLETPAANKKDLKDLIDQIVRDMYVVKYDGKSDTIITLRYPPLFEGATLTLTSFDSAKGEFNIRFENLTQVAKEIVDMKSNQESLLQALHKEGYNVHIISTSTYEANPIFTAEADQSREEQDRRQDKEDSSGRRKRDDET